MTIVLADIAEPGAFGEAVGDWFRRQDASDLSPQEWLARLNSVGFGAPSLDPHWGGGGFSAEQQAIIYEEWAYSGAPGVDLFVVSLHHVPATFLTAGTPEQQERFIRPAVQGVVWCQGFSEPGSGSDLSSLRCRAVHSPGEGGWRITGQKIWSSNAPSAERCLLLARTDPDSRGGRGIGYFALDLRQPGVTVRPIRQNTGFAEFAEIFLEDAFVADEDVIGPPGDGWRVAQATLAAERGPAGFDVVARLGHAISGLVPRVADDPRAAGRLADLAARQAAVRSLALRAATGAEDSRGADIPVLKVAFTELLRDVTALGLELGEEPATLSPERPHHGGFVSGEWFLDWVGSWGWTIAAGTNEIQRTLIAERVLGLPREPRRGVR